LSIIGVLLPLVVGGCSRPDEKVPPNVIIILVDTLRADQLEIYGYGRPTSPALQDLARKSVVFENAYGASPWTLPTVVSLMTSTWPCEHRVTFDWVKPDADLPMLAERMKKLGYATANFYANIYAGPPWDISRGFDQTKQLRRKHGNEQVMSWIDEHPQDPFFLYVHRIEPHDPYTFASRRGGAFRWVAPQRRAAIRDLAHEYRRLTRVDFSERNSLGTTDNTAEQDAVLQQLFDAKSDYVELYDATVRQVDTRIQRLIDGLKTRGLWENTLLIITADHGEEFGEHGGWAHDQSVYQELLHVPLLIRLPGDEFGGTRVASPARTIDVLPTVFDYLGKSERATDARGRSLLPAMRGEPGRQPETVLVGMRINKKKYYRPWKESRGDINIALRRGKWKAIWNVEPDTLELYDLERDPQESHDLSAARPKLAAAMREAARTAYDDCSKRQRRPIPKKDFDEETTSILQDLGYVGDDDDGADESSGPDSQPTTTRGAGPDQPY